MSEYSHLQKQRQNFQPKLPRILRDIKNLQAKPVEGEHTTNPEVAKLFPKTMGQPKLEFAVGSEQPHQVLRVGVVLSGGQAAGGHNVITGLFDAMKEIHPESRLFGFLNGPSGITDNDHIELTEDLLAVYRNQGGFDLIGAGRTKIETSEQFQQAVNTVKELQLDGLVIIGGDDSNTNAALLAEHFEENGVSTRVVGVPKTIDGDLKNEEIEISFGFDTATKTFSETIGSILRDSLSAKKYYFFIKLMGRSASHIALECALQTHPNLTLIGEEVAAEQQTLQELTNQVCDLICSRADEGKNYGAILIPEGIIEFIPEMKILIQELNRLKIDKALSKEEKITFAEQQLSSASKKCFDYIPKDIQAQLLLDRDPHGNVQVSKIETERLFIEAVKQELKKRKSSGTYVGKFSAQPLFCGYEGRSCYPSNFDAQYCYALGYVVTLLIDSGATGYMSCVQNLSGPVEDWHITGIPLASMIHMEERKGKMKPVIQKALVDLDGTPFRIFKEQREIWGKKDEYRYPGPIQFSGSPEITDVTTLTLEYEHQRFASKV
ncbi:MAG: Pyrophosphate--fructose 6-phosphate 1-phosphotransferase [Chlamydiae bacterium]|nr:Pyrophosphate--fructose 6-phosphate 1-phosphotransferase [Chlamydiota bacterium]